MTPSIVFVMCSFLILLLCVLFAYLFFKKVIENDRLKKIADDAIMKQANEIVELKRRLAEREQRIKDLDKKREDIKSEPAPEDAIEMARRISGS